MVSQPRWSVNEASSNIVVWGVGTPRTLRVHWALHELSLKYRIEAIYTRTPAMEREDFMRVSPGSKIPGFQHGRLRITESGAITRYLMDTFSPQQWSPVERTEINRWIFFVLTELDATALYVIRRHAGLPEIYGEAPLAVSSAYAYAERSLAVLEDLFSDGRHYLVGDMFSEADIHLGTCLDWAEVVEIQTPAGLTAYHKRLCARAAYQDARLANGKPLGS